MNNPRTIAAVATPQGEGGIGIVRISGSKARTIAAELFVPTGSYSLLTCKGYTAMHGRVHDKDGDIDDAVALVFAAPKSYTGEDVVELSCHGGEYILARVLKAAIENGALPASRGEFTKRAFLNGKLSLTQAEAVMDIITAGANSGAKAALAAHDGALFKKIRNIIDRLVYTSGNISAWVDFPEEDVPEVSGDTLKAELAAVCGELEGLLKTFDYSSIIKGGIATAIVGKPNVGKSTLMNLLAGEQKSIVTEVAGTTRDVVEDTIRLGDVTLRLADTAGLRDTSDPVESIGVELSRKKLKQADLILAVFDSSEELTAEDISLCDSLGETPAIAVINKSDLPKKLNTEYISKHISHIVEISAATGEGKEQLTAAINEVFKLSRLDPAAAMLANERQRDCALRALELTAQAQAALSLTLDAVGVNIDCAIDALMELTGEKASEVVVDSVFERFCVGK